MPLFGSGAPKIKWTRRMIIVVSVLGVLLIAVIVLGVFLISNAINANRGQNVAARPTAAVTATIKVAEVQATAVVRPTAPSLSATIEPAAVTVPPATAGGGAVLPTAVQTPIPPPTAQAGGGGTYVQGTPAAGGGETQQLPGGSSGLTWLIPLGVVLVAAIAWWRWRRSRAES